MLLCAVGGYLWPEQTDPTGWSHLVGSPAVHPELLPAIISIQEVSSAQNSRGSAANGLHAGWGCNTKMRADYSTVCATEEMMAWPLVPRVVVKNTFTKCQLDAVLLAGKKQR